MSNYILLEQTAQARDHDTWQELMEQALAGLNCQVIQSTSDEAPGLLAYVEHHLRAHHSPDLFHVQHELSKAVSAPMAVKQRAAAKAATQAEETRKRVQGSLDHAHDEPTERRPGRPSKPWLTVILDDYSRAVAGFMIAFEAPSALHTALALRQAIWRKPEPTWQVCGIPGILYTDHGSDFTSQHLEQVCADLKIQTIFSQVGQPRGRGRIERFFNTVNQVLLARLPGYAPAGFAAQVTPGLDLPGFTQAFAHFVLHEYHQTSHSTTGITPQARWSANGFLPQLPVSLDQLDLLLLTVVKSRRVHARRDGGVFLDHEVVLCAEKPGPR